MYRMKEKTINWIIFSVLVIFAFVMMLPLFWMLIQSLQSDGSAIYKLPPVLPNPISFNAYKVVFTQWNIPKLLLNTLTIMLGIMVLTLFSCIFVGYGFARLRAKGKNIMFGILMSTMMLPWSVTLVPSYAVWSKLGFLGTYWPLILPAIGGGAFNIFLVRMFIMNIPRALDEAAVIDGCNRVTILIKILLPQLMPVLATIIIFTFNGVWNDYVGPHTYLKGYTDSYTLGVKLAISFMSDRGVMDWPKFMAASTMISAPVILVIFFAQNAFTRGIVATGLKD